MSLLIVFNWLQVACVWLAHCRARHNFCPVDFLVTTVKVVELINICLSAMGNTNFVFSTFHAVKLNWKLIIEWIWFYSVWTICWCNQLPVSVRVCVCTCMWVRVCTCVHTCVSCSCMCVCACEFVCVLACLHMCVCACMHGCMCGYVFVCVHVLCVYMHVCMCVWVWIHVCTVCVHMLCACVHVCVHTYYYYQSCSSRTVTLVK